MATTISTPFPGDGAKEATFFVTYTGWLVSTASTRPDLKSIGNLVTLAMAKLSIVS